MRFRRHRCRMCKDTGVVKVKRIIPTSELSALDRADIFVNGGYVYEWVEQECPKACSTLVVHCDPQPEEG